MNDSVTVLVVCLVGAVADVVGIGGGVVSGLFSKP